MNDIETRIRELLNESVDAELGPRRPAPPFEPPAVRKPRRWGPWATPLLAAAAVAALIGGTVAVAHVAHSEHHRPPATSIPPTPAPTSTARTSTAPTTHASKPSASAKSAGSPGTGTGPAGNTVHVPFDLQAWILAQPHPQLSGSCGQGGLVILGSPVPAHLTGNTTPDTAARLTCRDGTAGSPSETDIYGVVGDRYGLVYRVPAATDENGVQRANGEFSVSGNTLTVTIGGYTQHDPMCCASLHWTQGYTFDGTTVSQGPLVSQNPLITFNGVGAVRLGMSSAQLLAAMPDLQHGHWGTGSSKCTNFWTPGSTPGEGLDHLEVLIADPAVGVVGIQAPPEARTSAGLGVGSTKQQVLQAYAGQHVEYAKPYGTEVLLVRGASTWLGFSLDGNNVVGGVAVGSKQYASGMEICS